MEVVKTLNHKNSIKLSSIKNELEMGVKVEKEHKEIYDDLKKKFGEKFPWTLDEFYKKIAMAHLDEFKDYYTKLKKMEEEANKNMKNAASNKKTIRISKSQWQEIGKKAGFAGVPETESEWVEKTLEQRIKQVICDTLAGELNAKEIEKQFNRSKYYNMLKSFVLDIALYSDLGYRYDTFNDPDGAEPIGRNMNRQ